MKIQIERTNEAKVEFELVGDIVMISEEPFLISLVEYNKCRLISLADGNRYSDESIQLEGMTREKIVESLRSKLEEYARIEFVSKDKCKLIVNLE